MTDVLIEIAPGVRMRPNGRLEVVDADVERGFAEAVRRLRPFVLSRANRLAGGDRDVARDLAQQAWIKLWELDPLRFDDEDEAYVRSALANHMRDWVRREQGRFGQGPVDGVEPAPVEHETAMEEESASQEETATDEDTAAEEEALTEDLTPEVE